MLDQFSALDTKIVAISQEDEDLSTFAGMPARLKPMPLFDVLADLKREKTVAYDRTTAYLIDKQGIVRQVFPMVIHSRPSWKIVLAETKKMLKAN
jgi:peroxiredoxin